jgi:RNA polymerase sigma factor (sigma-70 family)
MQTEVAENADQIAHQDETTVAAVKGGDVERYRELVERHERRVYAIAWSRLGDAALAEDAAQEAFIRAYRRLWLLGDGAKFAAWINTIARRVAINFGLRHRRELDKCERWALEQTPSLADHSPVGEADVSCTLETLRRALSELSEAHRECLVLFYLEGKSGTEAAATLGISEAAFRVRLHRARSALRERLEERLADSLEQLKPSKSLVPAVMAGVLASKSAAGGGTALLGALAKFLPFKWLLLFGAAGVGVLPGTAMSALAARAEQRNYREPEGFRAQANRAMHRRIIWLVPLIVIPMVVGINVLISRFGKHSDAILAVFMVGIFVFFWITQRNRFQSGILIWYSLLTWGMVLTATGLVPPDTYALIFVAATVWLMWLTRKQPVRMDYSLFLRANLGMLEVPPADLSADAPVARLEKSGLMRFARFLGDRWLVNDYRWRPEGLLLRQKFLNPLRANKACWLSFSVGIVPIFCWRGTVK